MRKIIVFASLLTLIIVVLFLIAGASLNKNAQSHESMLKTYAARKEDLLFEQQNLSRQLATLNATLQLELAKEQELSKSLDELRIEVDKLTNAQPGNAPVVRPTPSFPAINQVPPRPALPVQRPLTRAS